MKMKAILTVVLLAATAFSMAQSQPRTTADRVQVKLKQVDLLNMILPALMTGDQIKAILPVIERARKADADLKVKEEAELRKLEPMLDQALKAGIEKQEVVKAEVMGKIAIAFQGMGIAREAMINEQVANVLAVVEKNLNKGQQRAAANGMGRAAFGRVDPATLDDAAKLRFWVANVLMDPDAYDILLRLYRTPGQ